MKIITDKRIVEKVVKEEVPVNHLVVSKQDLLKWLPEEAAKELAYRTLLDGLENDFESIHPSLWISCLFRWENTPQGHKYWEQMSDRWENFLECYRLTSQADDIVSQKSEEA